MPTPRTYRIPVSWSMADTLLIEADSLEQAIEMAHDRDLADGWYVWGTWDIDRDAARENDEEDRAHERIQEQQKKPDYSKVSDHE